jgi:hypothetical protein
MVTVQTVTGYSRYKKQSTWTAGQLTVRYDRYDRYVRPVTVVTPLRNGDHPLRNGRCMLPRTAPKKP